MKQEYHSNATTNIHIRFDINRSDFTNLMLANKFGISEPTVSIPVLIIFASQT